MLTRTGLAILLLMLVLPRFTVHSHAALGSSGIGSVALLRHMQLSHTALDRDIPADKLHLHWCLSGCDVALPAANELAVAVPGTEDVHDLLGGFDFGLTALLPLIGSEAACEFVAPTGLRADTMARPDLRICFCVWTC